jgi:hypothetical protein
MTASLSAGERRVVVREERRIERNVLWMRVAAVLCAFFAAAGITLGIREANVFSGWVLPAFAGLVAAAAFASFWHVSIGNVVGMIKPSMLFILFALAGIVTAVALGASAQAIATAVAGRAAVSAELSTQVNPYNDALAEAYARGTGWGSISTAAIAKSTGLNGQAELEELGQHGTGKGCGVRCAQLKEMSGAFSDAHDALDKLLKDAADDRKEGDAAMQRLRLAAVDGDQPGFMTAAGDVSSTIAKLNAIDPWPVIRNTGAVHITVKDFDLTPETKDFYAIAEKVLANRPSVNAPIFVPMSVGEATRRQVFGSALHGWVLAGAIDVLPLLLLVLAFVLSRERWLNETVTRAKLTPEGQNEQEQKKLDDMLGRRRVVPFRDVAE